MLSRYFTWYRNADIYKNDFVSVQYIHKCDLRAHDNRKKYSTPFIKIQIQYSILRDSLSDKLFNMYIKKVGESIKFWVFKNGKFHYKNARRLIRLFSKHYTSTAKTKLRKSIYHSKWMEYMRQINGICFAGKKNALFMDFTKCICYHEKR